MRCRCEIKRVKMIPKKGWFITILPDTYLDEIILRGMAEHTKLLGSLRVFIDFNIIDAWKGC